MSRVKLSLLISISVVTVLLQGCASKAKPFDATWESLQQYQAPEWFRDAKFGIWAHWGPQAVPGQGDWYARRMYLQGDGAYNYHVKTYGHPTEFGYKDIIPLWKAEKWDPDYLMSLYKKAGAKYFVSMAVHHDNFDLWDSTYHRWNAVKMGPQRDIVGQWQDAAEKYGLYFGVSEHLAASYTWFTSSHGADKDGPKAGVPYDGTDSKYWDLYHPKHDEPFGSGEKWYGKNPQWHLTWDKRIRDLLDQYQPDLLYSDGGFPFGEVGRGLVAHFYNTNMQQHRGKLQAVYTCKEMGSGEFNRQACVQDVERGAMQDINPLPWQTDTSNGDWYYRTRDRYKTTGQVIRLLADIVSKNGNMLLNIVLRPDGSLPPESEKLLAELGPWMDMNGEAIYGTRPWKVYGEGPTVVGGGHFKEDYPFKADDIRFTTKGNTLYAIALGVPTADLKIKSLAGVSISDCRLVGSKEKLQWTQDAEGLTIKPVSQWPCDHAVVFKMKIKH
ncbi:MAG: alpha-L-fucosidase [Sedimentisphaerales bacterium]|nr:alpha-L-fucosidase [Sedimentisphaerales bacterium]